VRGHRRGDVRLQQLDDTVRAGRVVRRPAPLQQLNLPGAGVASCSIVLMAVPVVTDCCAAVVGAGTVPCDVGHFASFLPAARRLECGFDRSAGPDSARPTSTHTSPSCCFAEGELNDDRLARPGCRPPRGCATGPAGSVEHRRPRGLSRLPAGVRARPHPGTRRQIQQLGLVLTHPRQPAPQAARRSGPDDSAGRLLPDRARDGLLHDLRQVSHRLLQPILALLQSVDRRGLRLDRSPVHAVRRRLPRGRPRRRSASADRSAT
jgi:hypothetical protein